MKTKINRYAILIVLFMTISIIVFLIPTKKAASFWVTYAFTALAFGMQVYIWKLSDRGNNLKSKFLSIPIIHIGLVYLIVQIIALIVFTAISFVPAWIAIITSSALFCIAVLLLVSANAAKDEITRVEGKIHEKTLFLNSIKSEVEIMAGKEQDTVLKAKLIDLAERIRYSDPMSSTELADIEAHIAEKISALVSSPDKCAQIEDINLLLSERNAKCKLLKA